MGSLLSDRGEKVLFQVFEQDLCFSVVFVPLVVVVTHQTGDCVEFLCVEEHTHSKKTG